MEKLSKLWIFRYTFSYSIVLSILFTCFVNKSDDYRAENVLSIHSHTVDNCMQSSSVDEHAVFSHIVYILTYYFQMVLNFCMHRGCYITQVKYILSIILILWTLERLLNFHSFFHVYDKVSKIIFIWVVRYQ